MHALIALSKDKCPRDVESCTPFGMLSCLCMLTLLCLVPALAQTQRHWAVVVLNEQHDELHLYAHSTVPLSCVGRNTCFRSGWQPPANTRL
jgi:hypothetical protein